MQLIHHVINYRLTLITEVENMASGQEGGRAGRGVDLNQRVTSETQRLKRRIFRLDIDFKNAFKNALSWVKVPYGRFCEPTTSRM